MEKVRFGIIGLGNQGSAYIFNIFGKDKVENGYISALCDNNPEKIKNVKARLQDKSIEYFTDYKEMLDSGLCDAVLVETPHYQHPEIVIECLKRDINVLCDKPAGVYAKQVAEMNAAAEKSKALMGIMFNQRTNCVYRKMREIVAQGGIGEIQRVNWIITDWFRTQHYYDMGSWRATWKGEGGGVLINQCPHQLDLVQWVVGKMPVSVNGFCKYGRWHDIEVEDEVTAYFEYDNGATGVFITTTGEAPGINRFEISGTRGRVTCENGRLFYTRCEEDSAEVCKNSDEAFAVVKSSVTEVVTDGKNEQHAGIINNFTNAVLGKEPLFVKGTEGINGVELMNAIEYSGWHGGEKVLLPVNPDEYLTELNKHREKSVEKHADDSAVADTSDTYAGSGK